MSGEFSHLDNEGKARMVDVSEKGVTDRRAMARLFVRMPAHLVEKVTSGDLPKGNVFETARIAGIAAAKRTADLIPLCHNIPLSHVNVDFEVRDDGVEVSAVARATWKTGVEMEALTAASVAALTVYDMCKAVTHDMVITELKLMEKKGGKSGEYRREGT